MTESGELGQRSCATDEAWGKVSAEVDADNQCALPVCGLVADPKPVT
jgi:hypothetical protein